MKLNYVVSGTGNVISLNAPIKLSSDDLHSMAVALSRICRFNGFPINRFYSVLEHSLLCYRIAQRLDPLSKPLRVMSLLHDFHEAITGDIITPIKEMLCQNPEYQGLELRIDMAVHEAMSLTPGSFMNPAVKQVDTIAFYFELYYLVAQEHHHLFADPEAIRKAIYNPCFSDIFILKMEPNRNLLVNKTMELLLEAKGTY